MHIWEHGKRSENEVYNNVNTTLADHKIDDNLKFDGMTLSLWRIRKWKNDEECFETKQWRESLKLSKVHGEGMLQMALVEV